MRFIYLIFIGLLLQSISAKNICFAQQDTSTVKLVKITLKDDSKFIGKIISEDSLVINFETTGKISILIPKNQIKSTEILSGEVRNGEFLTRDPNESRLFFAPTARPIKAGEGYFSIYEIFFPTISVGIADILSLSAGISLIPGANSQLIYFAPKITAIQKGDFSAAAGLFYINASSGSSSGAGIVYGLTTYGNTSAALTVGAGWGFSGEYFSDTPVIVLGGEIRLSNSVKFITENWIPVETDYSIISFGLRFFGSKLAADIGFIRPSELNSNGFPFIPWLGFAYNF